MKARGGLPDFCPSFESVVSAPSSARLSRRLAEASDLATLTSARSDASTADDRTNTAASIERRASALASAAARSGVPGGTVVPNNKTAVDHNPSGTKSGRRDGENRLRAPMIEKERRSS